MSEQVTATVVRAEIEGLGRTQEAALAAWRKGEHVSAGGRAEYPAGPRRCGAGAMVIPAGTEELLIETKKGENDGKACAN